MNNEAASGEWPQSLSGRYQGGPFRAQPESSSLLLTSVDSRAILSVSSRVVNPGTKTVYEYIILTL